MATSMHLAWKHRLLQTTLTHLCGSTPQRSCQMVAQTLTPTQAKLMRIKRDIKVPRKKKRDSLAVLQALSDVTGKDHTVPDYKPTYTDDRYMIPYNQKAKSFRFAYSSGRATAQYFIQQFPECFDMKKSVPHVPALEPKQGRAKLEGNSEEALQERIHINLVSDAMQMYEKILEEGGTVSTETTEDLLDLVMFNFGHDQDKITSNPLNLQMASKWSHPEQLPGEFVREFIALVTTEKTPRMYKSIIMGFCKAENMNMALEYYEEMKGKGFQYDRDIIHALLSPSLPWTKNRPLTASIGKNLLEDMKKAGIAPTEETFKRLVAGPGIGCPDSTFFTKIFQEMKNLGMRPSLSICQAFLRFGHELSDFEQILDFVENENIKATCEGEMTFFIEAMSLCESAFRSPALALRVDKLFRTLGEGYYFHTIDESKRYYRPFLYVFLKWESLEKAMEIYQKIIPHKLQPLGLPLQSVFGKMKANKDFRHITTLFLDVFLTKKEVQMTEMQELLEVIRVIEGPQEVLQELSDVFKRVTDEWKRFSMKKSKARSKQEINYFVLATKISRLAGHFDRAWNNFELIEGNDGLKEDQCIALLHQCVQREEESKAERVETYMKNHL